MRINHNISALQTNAHMRRTDKALDKAMARLSSGYKINRASDDAAGMAISRKMKTQIEGLERASMNGSDGISVIQTAEGALNEVTSILQRCRELAVQGANDTLSSDDKTAIQKEINQLMDEVQRISDTTEFNTKKLLNGNLDNNSYTSNDNNKTGVNLIYTSDTVKPGDYKISVTKDPRQAVLNCEAPTLDTVADNQAGTVSINGVTVSIDAGQTREEWYGTLRDTCDVLGIDVFYGTAGGGKAETAGYKDDNPLGTGNLVFVSRGYGSSQKISISCDNTELAKSLGLVEDTEKTVEAKGVDAEVKLGDGFKQTATYSSDGNIVTVKDRDGVEMRFRIDPGSNDTTFTDATGKGAAISATPNDPAEEFTSTLLSAGTMYLQVGANENQVMEVKIPRVDPEVLGISNANVMTHENADMAIKLFDDAVNFVSQVRAKLGAYQNRLEHTITDLDTTGLNMTEAMSRLMDANMATEITNSTQQNVLQQAGTAMLAQANERPQTILSLLNG